MRRIFNILMGVSALIAIFMIGHLIYGLAIDGFSEGGGMTILVLELFGGLGSLGAILFGAISFGMGKRLRPPATDMGKSGIVIGILGLATLGILMTFFSV